MILKQSRMQAINDNPLNGIFDMNLPIIQNIIIIISFFNQYFQNSNQHVQLYNTDIF